VGKYVTFAGSYPPAAFPRLGDRLRVRAKVICTLKSKSFENVKNFEKSITKNSITLSQET
jgi:hypothetical protein